jgi:hypothetical protein
MGTKLLVDPGFVHHRKIEAILGPTGTEIITNQIAQLPPSTPQWRREVLIDHIYSRITLDFCGVIGIKSLEQLLAEQAGHMFCSIVRLKPCPEIYDRSRIVIRCEHAYRRTLKVELHLTTSRIRSDTLHSGLSRGGDFAIVAQLVEKQGTTLVFHPLLIGYPYLSDAESGELLWKRYTNFYRVNLEDFREFALVAEHQLPKTFDEMARVSEPVFKRCLGKILNESTPRDWGGESSDLFTSHLHIGEQRVNAAFLLKGPAKFSPMTLRHLGKNSDQIVRLSKEPTDVLVVQHCHDILPSVAETLKVFATQPSNPRRYCLIDGRESLRMLKAFGLLEWALNESRNLRSSGRRNSVSA